MMKQLKQQRLILSIICVFFIFSCNEKTHKNKSKPLDCILAEYIHFVKPNNKELILITEEQFWTKNSSYITVSKINKQSINNGYKYLTSTFKGVQILYNISALHDNNVDSSKVISTNIDFKDYVVKDKNEDRNEFVKCGLGSLKQVVFEYNTEYKKNIKFYRIESENRIFKEQLKKNCIR